MRDKIKLKFISFFITVTAIVQQLLNILFGVSIIISILFGGILLLSHWKTIDYIVENKNTYVVFFIAAVASSLLSKLGTKALSSLHSSLECKKILLEYQLPCQYPLVFRPMPGFCLKLLTCLEWLLKKALLFLIYIGWLTLPLVFFTAALLEDMKEIDIPTRHPFPFWPLAYWGILLLLPLIRLLCLYLLDKLKIPLNYKKLYSFHYDSMEGHEFEFFCADILRHNGFRNVKITQGSGDQGIDILAYKGFTKYAIQCKCYSDKVGNSAIQEAYAGKTFYHCNVAAVITNNYFTTSAIALAKQTNVILWNRDDLERFIANFVAKNDPCMLNSDMRTYKDFDLE